MIDSMFLGIFAGMLSCLGGLLLNCKLTQNQDVDPLFGVFAFIVADECVNSTWFERFPAESE